MFPRSDKTPNLHGNNHRASHVHDTKLYSSILAARGSYNLSLSTVDPVSQFTTTFPKRKNVKKD